jgi:cytochrome b6-f complex iron-sulfur subunit
MNNIDRRSFIEHVFGWTGILALTTVVLKYISSSKSKQSSISKVVIGKREELFANTDAIEYMIGNDKTIILQYDDEFKAFDAACTHAGCPVNWDSRLRNFICKCHGGVFNEKGDPISGPPKTSLQQYKVLLRENTDEIILYK